MHSSSKSSDASRLLVLVTLLPMLGCPGPEPPPLPTGQGIFLRGCPEPGKARALELVDPAMTMTGTDVLGGPGDWLLYNENAAFIVQGAHASETYYYYGGNLIDAVEVSGCAQAGPEQYGELELLFGTLDLFDFPASNLRGFGADRVEILSDGSDGGEARLRVFGSESVFWLVEYMLTRDAVRAGGSRDFNVDLGVEVTLDYVLKPGSSVLEMELHMTNRSGVEIPMMVGGAMFPSDLTPRIAWSQSVLEVGGYSLPYKMPWVSHSSGEAAYAYALDGGNLGSLTASGVNVLANVDQVFNPISLSASELVTETVRMYVAVGSSDHNSATRKLAEVSDELVPGWVFALSPVSGTVIEDGGAAVAGAEILVQLRDSDGLWQTLDSLRADDDGAFAGQLAQVVGNETVRLVPRAPGRDDGPPVEVTLPSPSPISLGMEQRGTLSHQVTDGDGDPLPALIYLRRGDGARVKVFAAPGDGSTPVSPGSYDYTASRGYEYGVQSGTVEIVAGATAVLQISLPHLVDTEGWFSQDSHVHAAPSEDSDVPEVERALHAAAGGLDIWINTDHEIIADSRPAIESAGLSGWVHGVVGEEYTAVTPEHMTLYPLVVDPTLPRGGPPRWMERGMQGAIDVGRERGAELVGLNHPREGCNWMCLIGYDGVTGEPEISDPTVFGLPADTTTWSFDFDFIEYQNGALNPFRDPEAPGASGHFDDWQSFLNLGHRITAVGSSDIHGVGIPGNARTYVQVDAADVSELSDDGIVAAMKDGRVLVSTGAFARISVNGEGGIGELVTDTDGMVSVDIHVEAIPEIDVQQVMVTYNCDTVAWLDASDPDGVVKLDSSIDIPALEDGHIAVLGFGTRRHPAGLANFDPRGVPRFTANALFVDADGDGQWSAPGGKLCDYSWDDIMALPEAGTPVGG